MPHRGQQGTSIDIVQLKLKLAEVDEAIAKHHKLIRLAEECRFAELVNELQAEVDRDGRWRSTLATIIERLSADPPNNPIIILSCSLQRRLAQLFLRWVYAKFTSEHGHRSAAPLRKERTQSSLQSSYWRR